MATPAQIANDMAAHAAYWEKRNKAVTRACHDAAHLIRLFLDGKPVDGRTFSGVWVRLLRLENPGEPLKGYPDFSRARNCLTALRGRR